MHISVMQDNLLYTSLLDVAPVDYKIYDHNPVVKGDNAFHALLVNTCFMQIVFGITLVLLQNK